ncbi:hypothetical protein B296_00031897 [Ensete ventricosum]|uniref:Helicase C-terminal domain-containing protein n=1 Tax=Ensete ventricosum TaxID=4639 RepID=A0A427AF36_ENSVE|nr:hypothetical protein B296_00031897 [Ensete ventricosum]
MYTVTSADTGLIIHYELPNDPETFVHRSGRTGRAGKEGTAILMFTSSQRRTVKSLERDVGCRFEFISPPQMQEILESSAEQVVATLQGVHPESIQYFLPTAQRLTDEQGTQALAAALAHLSGFSQPPSSRSLINHEQVKNVVSHFIHSDYSSCMLFKCYRIYDHYFLRYKMMVLLLTIMAGFQTESGDTEVVLLGIEIRGVLEVRVHGTPTVMMAYDVEAGSIELTTAGLDHQEGVRMTGYSVVEDQVVHPHMAIGTGTVDALKSTA